MNNRIWITLLTLLVTASIMITGCQSGHSSWTSENWTPSVGGQSFDFELNDLNGQPVSLSGLQGRPVMINFWATWCSPCTHEMPFIQSVHEDWSSNGLIILAVNINQSAEQVRQFMEENQYSFTVLLDTSSAVADRYQVSGIPTTIFVDTEGIIRGMRTGAYASQTALEADLSQIMAGPPDGDNNG